MMPQALLAGAAETVITPPLGISLQGALHDRKANDVHDDLYAKALVLDDGSHPLALVILDVILIREPDVAAIRQLVAQHTHIPAANVLVACTHTHSGPAMMTMAGITHDPSYIDWLVRRAADSVRLASRRLQPARVGTGVGHEANLSFCRRFLMKDGTVRFNPGRGNSDIVKPTGPIDPDVGVLYVETLDGTPLAAAVNFCLHYVGTDESLAVSADYFGHFAHAMRRVKGPEFVSLLFNGAQGQINNIDVHDPEQLRGHTQGRRVAEVLAGEVTKVIGTMKTTSHAVLDAASKPVSFRRKDVTAADIEVARRILASAASAAGVAGVTGAPSGASAPGGAVAASDAVAARAAGPSRSAPASTSRSTPPSAPSPDTSEGPFSWVVGQPIPAALRSVYAEECLAVAELREDIHTELQVLRIGDTALVGLPGEMFVEIGLEIKACSSAAKTFVIGLANGFVGYVPTDKALTDEGGYETWTSRWSLPGVGAEGILTREARALIGRLFTNRRWAST